MANPRDLILAAGTLRPREPRRPRSNAPLNRNWRHIFPDARMRGIWNALIEELLRSQEMHAATAVKRFLAATGYGLADLDALAARLRRGDFDDVTRDAIRSRVVWQPWNVVEGPAPHLRIDDPGDDDIHRFTFGLTIREYHRITLLDAIDRETLPSQFGPDTQLSPLRAVADAFHDSRPVLNCEHPIFYRPNMWVEVAPHTFHKRRSGEQFILG